MVTRGKTCFRADSEEYLWVDSGVRGRFAQNCNGGDLRSRMHASRNLSDILRKMLAATVGPRTKLMAGCISRPLTYSFSCLVALALRFKQVRETLPFSNENVSDLAEMFPSGKSPAMGGARWASSRLIFPSANPFLTPLLTLVAGGPLLRRQLLGDGPIGHRLPTDFLRSGTQESRAIFLNSLSLSAAAAHSVPSLAWLPHLPAHHLRRQREASPRDVPSHFTRIRLELPLPAGRARDLLRVRVRLLAVTTPTLRDAHGEVRLAARTHPCDECDPPLTFSLFRRLSETGHQQSRCAILAHTTLTPRGILGTMPGMEPPPLIPPFLPQGEHAPLV